MLYHFNAEELTIDMQEQINNLKQEIFLLDLTYWSIAKKFSQINNKLAQLHFGFSDSFCQMLKQVSDIRLRKLANHHVLHFSPRYSERDLINLLFHQEHDWELLISKQLLQTLNDLQKQPKSTDLEGCYQ